MRPARKGPENRLPSMSIRVCATSFNEAGPQGAGKPRVLPSVVPGGVLLQ